MLNTDDCVPPIIPANLLLTVEVFKRTFCRRAFAADFFSAKSGSNIFARALRATSEGRSAHWLFELQ